MSVKRYGIYLGYGPGVDLKAEGLGRHLAMFLKGAEELNDVHFTVVCPSWSAKGLLELFKVEQLTGKSFQIVCPDGVPYAVKLLLFFRGLRREKKKNGFFNILPQFKLFVSKILNWWGGRLVKVHSPSGLFVFVLYSISIISAAIVTALPLLALALPLFGLFCLFSGIKSGLRKIFNFCLKKIIVAGRVSSFLSVSSKRNGWATHFLNELLQSEMQRMHLQIEKMRDISAWYSPTAFWPSFNKIDAPKLMCVPDVVLADFPVGFSQVGGETFKHSFDTIGDAIRQSDNIVTYSQSIKWATVVDKYLISPSRVSVIPHAPMMLNEYTDVSGSSDAELASRQHCEMLLQIAMNRCLKTSYFKGFENKQFKFIFYASQIRPHKNVITLLRAYEYLLRRRFLGHKLVLTGNYLANKELVQFVEENRLEKDVLFMHGLSIQELSAFYKLADLAVNPTLSEGGCPFTFTEALSVGTPVVMSRISVTEEVIQNTDLQEKMLFDPYDWRDCAQRVEWALKNKEDLRREQLELYKILCRRTWTDVVSEYVQVLERIATK